MTSEQQYIAELRKPKPSKPVADYVLVSDMEEIQSDNYGNGLFCTFDAVRPAPETCEQPTREEALRRIEEACRSIEILCDHFGMDPAEFLADSRSEKALEPLTVETRAATSRDARSTEGAGRPGPSESEGEV